MTGAGLKSFRVGEDDFRLCWVSPVTFWKIWSLPALGYCAYQLTIANPEQGTALAIGLAAIAIMFAAGGAIFFLVLSLKVAFDNICPDMKRSQDVPVAE